LRTCGMRRVYVRVVPCVRCQSACAVHRADACAPFGFGFAESSLRKLRFLRRIPTVLAREMRRPALRPPRSAIVRLRSGAVASRSGAFRIAAFRDGGGGPRGWHGRAAVFGAPPLRADACAPFGFGFAESSLRFASAHFRESAFIRDGLSIRRYGALGLVAMPPCANRIRPGGVLPLAASDSLWPRGRHASPLRAIGTCPFLRRAFRTPYIEQGESFVS
jgi:hypothetical protein